MMTTDLMQPPTLGDLVWLDLYVGGGHSEFKIRSSAVFLGKGKNGKPTFILSGRGIIVEVDAQWHSSESIQLAMALSIVEANRSVTRAGSDRCWINGLSHDLYDGAVVSISLAE